MSIDLIWWGHASVLAWRNLLFILISTNKGWSWAADVLDELLKMQADKKPPKQMDFPLILQKNLGP